MMCVLSWLAAGGKLCNNHKIRLALWADRLSAGKVTQSHIRLSVTTQPAPHKHNLRLCSSVQFVLQKQVFSFCCCKVNVWRAESICAQKLNVCINDRSAFENVRSWKWSLNVLKCSIWLFFFFSEQTHGHFRLCVIRYRFNQQSGSGSIVYSLADYSAGLQESCKAMVVTFPLFNSCTVLYIKCSCI